MIGMFVQLEKVIRDAPTRLFNTFVQISHEKLL